MKKTALVIIAAGIGSRFEKESSSLHPGRPEGRIDMDYSIHDALEAEIQQRSYLSSAKTLKMNSKK